MKRRQIHLYLSESLFSLIQQKSESWGLTPSQYVKFILIRDVGEPLTSLNIRKTLKPIKYED